MKRTCHPLTFDVNGNGSADFNDVILLFKK
jgi:hypothetical protein